MLLRMLSSLDFLVFFFGGTKRFWRPTNPVPSSSSAYAVHHPHHPQGKVLRTDMDSCTREYTFQSTEFSQQNKSTRTFGFTHAPCPSYFNRLRCHESASGIWFSWNWEFQYFMVWKEMIRRSAGTGTKLVFLEEEAVVIAAD